MKTFIIKSNKYGDKTALIDDEDYEFIIKYKWHLNRSIRKDQSITYYAESCICINGYRTTLLMHRLIMNATNGVEIDHINHNGIDNRKENLRLVNHQSNHFNRRGNPNSTSQFKGVSFYKPTQKWMAQITINDQSIKLGYFEHEEDAARQYDYYAIRYFGKYAYLNFPDYDYSNYIPYSYKNNCSSKLKGVAFHKRDNKYQASVGFNGKVIYLGYFEDEIEAAKARDKFIIDNNLNIKKLNFPDTAAQSLNVSPV